MSTSAIGGSSGSYLLEAISNALQSDGITGNTSGAASTSAAAPSDSSQLSPFAQLASAFQQLQESNPTAYSQLTQQIATNLQNESQSAQSQGNSNVAGALSQLANDFSSASRTGQLPNLQDLAQALGGGSGASGAHGHHHHHHSESASPDSGTSSYAASSSSVSSASSASSASTGAIIVQTLSNAGIDTSSLSATA